VYWAFWFYRNKRPKYDRAVERFGLKEESIALIGNELSAELKIRVPPKREPDQEPRSLKELSIFSTQFNSEPVTSTTNESDEDQPEVPPKIKGDTVFQTVFMLSFWASLLIIMPFVLWLIVLVDSLVFAYALTFVMRRI
jgi:hypothetical protein